MNRIDAADVIGGIGFGLLSFGLALISIPLALIVMGALLLSAGIVGSR